VYYDDSITSEQEILSLEVFDEYPATVLGKNSQSYQKTESKTSVSTGGSCSGGCGGSGSCGGSCGSPTCDYNK